MRINERMGIGLGESTTSGKTFATRDPAGKIRVGQMMGTKVQDEPKIAVVLPTYREAQNIVRPKKLGLETAMISAFRSILSLENQPDYMRARIEDKNVISGADLH